MPDVSSGFYELKHVLPTLGSADMAFKAGRVMGRELDRPWSHEIIRPARIKDVDPETKMVAIEWLDAPGSQTNVLLTYPAVGNDWGIYHMPEINDWCICAFEGNRIRILNWVPRNTSKLRKLMPGEIMIESKSHATIMMEQSGPIHVTAPPENDPDKPDQSSNVPEAEMHIGRSDGSGTGAAEGGARSADNPAGSSGSADKKYQMWMGNQAAGRMYMDDNGNLNNYTSTNNARHCVGNVSEVFGKNHALHVKKNQDITVEKNRTVTVGGWYKLDVTDDYLITTKANYSMSADGTATLYSKGAMNIKSDDVINIQAPRVNINPSSKSSPVTVTVAAVVPTPAVAAVQKSTGAIKSIASKGKVSSLVKSSGKGLATALKTSGFSKGTIPQATQTFGSKSATANALKNQASKLSKKTVNLVGSPSKLNTARTVSNGKIASAKKK